MKNPIVILHLSDLHFGAQSRFAGRSFEELGQRLGQAEIGNRARPGARRHSPQLSEPYAVRGGHEFVRTGGVDWQLFVLPFRKCQRLLYQRKVLK